MSIVLKRHIIMLAKTVVNILTFNNKDIKTVIAMKTWASEIK